MNPENISKQSKKIVDRVTDAVEKTGKKVATQVSNLTDGKVEDITEEAIQAAVDRALDVVEVATKKVQERELDGERVTLEVGVNIVEVVRLTITTDVPGEAEHDVKSSTI